MAGVDELAAVSADDFEWQAEVERLLIGPCDWAVRVRYRQRSTRPGSSSQRWVSFLLVPAADDSFDEVLRTDRAGARLPFSRRRAGVAT